MATQVDKLTLQVAAATYKDMLEMVESEKRWRKDLLDGVSFNFHYSIEGHWSSTDELKLCKSSLKLSFEVSNPY